MRDASQGLGAVVHPFICKEGSVGANSQQGVALLVLFTSFTLASIGMYSGGSVVFLGLAAVVFAVSVAMFLKARPLEQ